MNDHNGMEVTVGSLVHGKDKDGNFVTGYVLSTTTEIVVQPVVAPVTISLVPASVVSAHSAYTAAITPAPQPAPVHVHVHPHGQPIRPGRINP
jgi:hypothetical protein